MIESKRLIVSMVVGGHMQFRSHVQGMPKNVEEKINTLKKWLYKKTMTALSLTQRL